MGTNLREASETSHRRNEVRQLGVGWEGRNKEDRGHGGSHVEYEVLEPWGEWGSSRAGGNSPVSAAVEMLLRD